MAGREGRSARGTIGLAAGSASDLVDGEDGSGVYRDFKMALRPLRDNSVSKIIPLLTQGENDSRS